MDPNKKAWQADFEQEVQRVMEDLGPSSGPRKDPEIPISESVIPPARVYVDLRTANDQLRELEAEAAELRRRYEHRSRQLEEELRGRDRLKDLVVRLNQSLRILEAEKSKADHLGENLTEQLSSAEIRARETHQALEESNKTEGRASAEVEILKAKVEEFTVLGKLKEEEFRSLQVRLQAVERSYSQQTTEWERQVREAVGKSEESKAKESRLAAREEAREAVAANTAAERSMLEKEVLALKEALEKTRLEAVAARDATSAVSLRLEEERAERENAERAVRDAKARFESTERTHLGRMRIFETEREDLRARLKSAIDVLEKERALAAEEIKRLQNQEMNKSEEFRREVQELVRERENLRKQSQSNVFEMESVKAHAVTEMGKALKLEAETRQMAEEEKAKLEKERAEATARLQEERESANAKLQNNLSEANARLQKEREQAMAEVRRAKEEFEAARLKQRADAESAVEKIRRAKGEIGAARIKQQAEAESAMERARILEENLHKRFEVERSAAQAEVRQALEKANMIETEGRRVFEAGRKVQFEAQGALAKARELEGEGRRSLEEARTMSLEGKQAREKARDLELEGRRAIDEARALEVEGRKAKEKASELDAQARLGTEKALEIVSRVRTQEEEAKRLLEAEKKSLEALRKISEKALSAPPVPSAGGKVEEQTLPIGKVHPADEKLPPVPQPQSPRKRQSESPSWYAGAVRAVAVALLTVVIAGGAAFFWFGRGKVVPHPVPFSHTTGLAWQGEDLWASDWRAETIFRLGLTDGKLKVKERFPLPGTHLSGIAVNGESLFICDSWAGTIERRRIAPGLPLEASWPAPGPMPTLLHHDGKYIWSADRSEGRVFRHDPETLVVLDSYPISSRLAAIAARDDSFWTVDSDKRIVVSHRWDAKLTPSRTFSLKALEEGRKSVSAFAWKGDSVWIAREGSSRILEAPWRLFKPRKD